jgi:methylated-DNA-[protein]-cysteine S-methyltransferase
MAWRSTPQFDELSPFTRAVLELCAAVPPGRVTTYGALAAALRNSSSQAVGTALSKNPFAPAVPCHRVIKTGGPPTIGGFCGHAQGSGHAEISRKRDLLAAEGVLFDDRLRLTTHKALLTDFDAPALSRALAYVDAGRATKRKSAPAPTSAAAEAPVQPPRKRTK